MNYIEQDLNSDTGQIKNLTKSKSLLAGTLPSFNFEKLSQQGYGVIAPYLQEYFSNLSLEANLHLQQILRYSTGLDPIDRVDEAFITYNDTAYELRKVAQAAKNRVDTGVTISDIVDTEGIHHKLDVAVFTAKTDLQARKMDVYAKIMSAANDASTQVSDLVTYAKAKLTEKEIKADEAMSQFIQLKSSLSSKTAVWTIFRNVFTHGLAVKATGSAISYEGCWGNDAMAAIGDSMLSSIVSTVFSAAVTAVSAMFGAVGVLITKVCSDIANLIPNFIKLFSGGGNLLDYNGEADIDGYSKPLMAGTFYDETHLVLNPGMFAAPTFINYMGIRVKVSANSGNSVGYEVYAQRCPRKFLKLNMADINTATTDYWSFSSSSIVDYIPDTDEAKSKTIVVPSPVYYRRSVGGVPMIATYPYYGNGAIHGDMYLPADIIWNKRAIHGNGLIEVMKSWVLPNLLNAPTNNNSIAYVPMLDSNGENPSFYPRGSALDGKSVNSGFYWADLMACFKMSFASAVSDRLHYGTINWLSVPCDDAEIRAPAQWPKYASVPWTTVGGEDVIHYYLYQPDNYWYTQDDKLTERPVWSMFIFPGYPDAVGVGDDYKLVLANPALSYDVTSARNNFGLLYSSLSTNDVISDSAISIPEIDSSTGMWQSAMAVDYFGIREGKPGYLDQNDYVHAVIAGLIIKAQTYITAGTTITNPYLSVATCDDLNPEKTFSLTPTSDFARWAVVASKVLVGVAALATVAVTAAKFAAKRMISNIQAQIEDKYWGAMGKADVSMDDKMKLYRKYNWIMSWGTGSVTTDVATDALESNVAEESRSDNTEIINLIAGKSE